MEKYLIISDSFSSLNSLKRPIHLSSHLSKNINGPPFSEVTINSINVHMDPRRTNIEEHDLLVSQSRSPLRFLCQTSEHSTPTINYLFGNLHGTTNFQTNLKKTSRHGPPSIANHTERKSFEPG